MTTTRPTRKVEVEKRRTCVQCGRVGHLATARDGSPRCTLPARRVDKVGIEIEGFWLDLATARERAEDLTGRQGVSDGSVEGGGECHCDEEEACSCGPTSGGRGWEFQTQAGTLGEALRQLTALYPDRTNRTCGLHIHLSLLHQDDYTLMCSDRFFVHYRDRMKAWGERLGVNPTSEFWTRLNNGNQYTRTNDARADWPHCDTRGSGAITECRDRYRQINFLAYAEHHTIEFRTLPMFQSAALAVSAVEELIEIVEGFLATEVVLHPTVEVEPTEVPPPVLQITDRSIDDQGVVSFVPIRNVLPDVEPLDLGYPEDAAPGTEVVPAWRALLRLEERARDAIVNSGLPAPRY